MESSRARSASIANYDAALIVTDNTAINWQQLVDAATLVIDTRNARAKAVNPRERLLQYNSMAGRSAVMSRQA
jgi:hypothetical protein